MNATGNRYVLEDGTIISENSKKEGEQFEKKETNINSGCQRTKRVGGAEMY